jgi:hypothetical protein
MLHKSYVSSSLWFITVLLFNVRLCDSAIKYINPGADVDAALKNVSQGDVLVFSPGVYSIKSSESSGATCPVQDITIIGSGRSPDDTVLVDFYLVDCDPAIGPALSNLVIQNVKIIGTALSNRGKLMRDDGLEASVIFRDCIINAPSSLFTAGIEKFRGNVALINSQLIGYGKSAGSVGVDMIGNPGADYGYGRLYLMNSIVRQFSTGFLQRYAAASGNDYIVIANTNLRNNTKSCDQPANIGSPIVFHNNLHDGTCKAGSTSANSLSATTVMILEFTHDFDKITWIKFTGITTGGHTTVYLLPSEYPAPPQGVITSLAQTSRVLYFQFITTAVLSKAPILMINKAFADSHFDLSTGKKISIYAYSGGKWVALTTSIGNAVHAGFTYPCYTATWPSTSIGLAAVFVK